MKSQSVNMGQLVRNYIEKFENSSKIEKQRGNNDAFNVDWNDINTDGEELGHGTYSVVHKVTLRGNAQQGKAFAQKILDTNLKGLNEARYKRASIDCALEAKLLERLNHLNIISLRGKHVGCIEHNINNETDPYFLLLDYLPKTLDSVLKDQKKRSSAAMTKLTMRTKSKMFDRLEKSALGIASAMEYLHANGVIFRDLKPQNVGFDENGTVKLFDFGNARELAFARLIGEDLGVAGTPRYMANEVGAGREYGFPSDVYSFGVLLWEIATLRIPFEGIYNMEEYQILVVQHHERPSLAHVQSEDLKALLRKCWDPVPRHRPTFTEIRTELERIVDMHRKSASHGRFSSFRRGNTSSRSLSPGRRRARGSAEERKRGNSLERNNRGKAGPEGRNRKCATKMGPEGPSDSRRSLFTVFSSRSSMYTSVEDDGFDGDHSL